MNGYRFQIKQTRGKSHSLSTPSTPPTPATWVIKAHCAVCSVRVQCYSELPLIFGNEARGLGEGGRAVWRRWVPDTVWGLS